MNTNSNNMRHYFMLLTALVFAGCGSGSDNEPVAMDEPAAEEMAEEMTDAPAAPDLASLLANESRSEADRARDAGRMPADVIAFLGIEPGMSVIDLIAASGYYTEVLSLAVGADGHVTAQNPAFVLEFREGANDKALNERLADDRLANVSRLDIEMADLTPEHGPFDAAVTALNFHDIYNGFGEEAAVGTFNIVYAVLNPGGVFGVIDHQGGEGNDNEALHRGMKADAIRVAEAAGFVVEGDSDLLHNADDDMTQGVFAEGIRGHTNRFLLKLRKPAE